MEARRDRPDGVPKGAPRPARSRVRPTPFLLQRMRLVLGILMLLLLVAGLPRQVDAEKSKDCEYTSVYKLLIRSFILDIHALFVCILEVDPVV